jgi:putative oxidoreductase
MNTTEIQSPIDTITPHAHWLLRVALASVFIYHGISKFAGGLTPPPMMELPVAVWALVAFAEVAGGVLILVGGVIKDRVGDIVTRLAGLAIAPVMLGAIFMVHWPRWNFAPAPDQGFPMGGMEFQVVLLLAVLYFLVRGNR